MLLKKLLTDVGIVFPPELGDIDVKGISDDSRKIKDGYIFVCYQGLHTDGHDKVAEAEKNGAVLIIGEKDDVYVNVPYIKVEHSRKCLAELFNVWYDKPTEKMKFIGVTGTNGKTTVTHIIKHIFENAGYKCGMIGTLGCFIGGEKLSDTNPDITANMTTPDPAELYKVLSRMYEAETEVVIMEASSHALSMEKLAPVHFDIGIFTNLSPEHMDYHHDMKNYICAKGKLFENCDVSIVNIDSQYSSEILKYAGSGKTLLCSTEGRDADCHTGDILNKGITGSEFDFVYGGEKVRVTLPLTGDYNIANCVQALACCTVFGIKPSSAVESVKTMPPVKGRLEKLDIPAKFGYSVFIDYAHTPDALEKMLETVRKMQTAKGRVIVLFGCGGDRDKEKRPVMGKIAVQLADFAVITSDNPRNEDRFSIINDILSGVSDHHNYAVIPDRKKAIEWVLHKALPYDIIILSGKGHEDYEIIKGRRIAFSEKETVGKIIAEAEDENKDRYR